MPEASKGASKDEAPAEAPAEAPVHPPVAAPQETGSVEKGLDPWITAQWYYHGYIPRQDVCSILTKHGDFLVRSTETPYITKTNETRRKISPIICVILDPENIYEKSSEQERLEMVRNFIIHVKSGKTFLDPRYKFETAAEMFQYHMKTPFTINEREVSLMRGVGLTEWEFEHKHVNVGRLIGRGQYGEVRRGTLKLKSGTVVTVAIKSCKMDGTGISKGIIKDVMKEARLMRELNHPNVVKLYGVGVLECPLYILLEYVAGGALKSYLRRNKDMITNEERSHMALGAAWGIEHLHKKNIIHRDIAARNCLYDHDCAVKISDFGLSRTGSQYKMKTSKKMPIRWMAPESIATFMFTRKTDVYSFGILVYEIYSAHDPYMETGPGVVRKKIIDGEFNVFPDGTPENLIAFVEEKLWNKNPNQRADMDKVVEFFERFAGLTTTTQSAEAPNSRQDVRGSASAEDALTAEKKLEMFLKMRKQSKNNLPMKTQTSQE